MQNNNQPYRIVSFKEYVPDKARFWILIFFSVIFQFSNGVYLTLAGQMAASTALMHEDVMMAGYSCFAGMTMIFPLLFRFKGRFTTKTILLTASIGLIICNLLSMVTTSLPVMVIVSFMAGFLKIFGFFECMSTVQLKITPTRDFAVFFPVLYLLILGSVQISGITAGYISYYFCWEYMQMFMIGLLMFVVLFTYVLVLPVRMSEHKQPLSGIDWIGGALWSISLILVIFILVYGEHYDWLDSAEIRFAIIAAAATIIVNTIRAKIIKNPFISLKAFKFRHVDTILFLFTAMCILLSFPNILQNAFTGSILHYDLLLSVSLNWMILLGIVAGVMISYICFAKLKIGYRIMTAAGFAFITCYMVIFYFIISPDTSKEMLYFPLFCRGAGNTIIYIALTLFASRTIPFIFFFQVLAIFGFVRSGFGTPLGTAIVGNIFSASMKKNIMSHSMDLDLQNTAINTMPLNTFMSELYRQSMLVSIKEIYGYAVIAGVLILLMAVSARYTDKIKFKMPRW